MQKKINNLKEYLLTSVLFKEKAFAASPFLGTLTHLDKVHSFEIMSTSSIITLERGKRKGRGKQAED